jgi:uncharacterized protein (DUF58 family)
VQLYPTRNTVHVALAAVAVVAGGIGLRMPAPVAWGGAMIVGLAIARAISRLAIARLRTAGLEMTWKTGGRTLQRARGQELEVLAELKNRDTRPVRYAALRTVASSLLVTSIEPREGEVPAGGTLELRLTIRTPRVGRHGIHGLAMEVGGPRDVFEVPLAFASPLGVLVLPRPWSALATSARGGRARLALDAGPPSRAPGEGTEIFELREHSSGDPWKRIAWKASARRGRLMVREFEREERDVVWLILDGAVELWSGPLGRAPLDVGIDELATIAERHLARGDRIGLIVISSADPFVLAPDRGPFHLARLFEGLALGASTLDADRSELDEIDVARAVLEHMKFLDTALVEGLLPEQLDLIALRAETQLPRAPFDAPAPWARTERERALRRYLACFGVTARPRLDPDRSKNEERLARALETIRGRKPRASLVYVWSAAPEKRSEPLGKLVRELQRKGAAIRWIAARHEHAIDGGQTELGRIVADAVITRTRVARERGERILRSLGVRVVRAPSSRIIAADLPAIGERDRP